MRIYNTMTRQKEAIPSGEKLKIYACGPTVYNLIHIGNARQICVFDTLRRYLAYRGRESFFVQNFTDVDDKIIKKAAELGKSAAEVSENAIKEYFTDAHGLNVLDADIHPKVTENMEIIIDIVQKLVEKGYAYAADGDVYFRTSKFPEYGKLSHMPLEELMEGASERVGEVEGKENPIDFAVWKSAKPGEPYWASPFGNGRPGWHIECSAMSRHYIGDTLDIHGGGSDLIFPHHENEIAQSECATGAPLAKIWMHNGMLSVDSRKMSKSKNNFFLVRELSEEYGYEAVRFMLLSAHYRSQLNYAAEVMESAVNAVQRLKNCKQSLLRAIEAASEDGSVNEDVKSLAEGRVKQFVTAMDDDLNTADGLAAIFELVREINTLVQKNSAQKAGLRYLLEVLGELCGVLGLRLEEVEESIPEKILTLAEERKAARAAKDFALADKIRDEILAAGYVIEETRQGTFIRKK